MRYHVSPSKPAGQYNATCGDTRVVLPESEFQLQLISLQVLHKLLGSPGLFSHLYNGDCNYFYKVVTAIKLVSMCNACETVPSQQ